MTKNLRRAFLILLLMTLIQSAFFSSRALAMSQDTRTLIRGGTYGLVGGTIVGAAVLPLTGSVRGVFIGSSLGLYMGLLIGVYEITHEDEQGSMRRAERDVGQGMLAYRSPRDSSPRSPMEMPLATRISISMPVVQF